MNTQKLRTNVSRFLLLGLWLVLPLGQLLRWQVSPQAAVYPHDLILVLILALHFREIIRHFSQLNYRKMIGKWRLETAFVAWVLVGWVGLALTSGLSALVVPGLYTARLCVYMVSAWWICRQGFFSVSQLRTGWLSALAITAWLGIVQFIFVPDTRFIHILGWDDHYYRLIGTHLDPGFMGMLLVMFILGLWPYLWQMRRRWLAWVGVLVAIGGVVATWSRASYVTLVVGMAMTILIAAWKKTAFRATVAQAFVLVTLLAGLVIFAPKPSGEGGNLLRSSSVNARLATSEQTLERLEPLEIVVGGGLFTKQPPSFHQYIPYTAGFPDNLGLLFFSGTGVGGVILVGLLALKWGRWLLDYQSQLLPMMAAVIAHSQFNHTLFQPFVFVTLAWYVVAYLQPTTGKRL